MPIRIELEYRDEAMHEIISAAVEEIQKFTSRSDDEILTFLCDKAFYAMYRGHCTEDEINRFLSEVLCVHQPIRKLEAIADANK